jgi:hypothetical protein
MPSKKKTRKQKLLSDTRRTQVANPTSATYSLTGLSDTVTHAEKAKTIPLAQSITTQNYNYLAHDLRKTLFLTIAIIVTQIVLLYVFHYK